MNNSIEVKRGNNTNLYTPNMVNTNKSLCTNYSSYLPDITGVSYISDGNTLKSILWLNWPFENPSFNDDTFLRIRVYDLTNRTQNGSFYDNYININFDKGHQKAPFEIINSTYENGTIKSTDKNEATKVKNYGDILGRINYIYTTDKGQNISGVMLLKKAASKKYVVIYETNANTFNDGYNETAEKILQAFDNLQISKNTTSENIWSGIKKQVPPNWIPFNQTKETKSIHKIFNFEPAPHWIDVRFVMTVHVISFYESGAKATGLLCNGMI